jgi:SAM-dependent methyltransferase
MVLFMLHKFWVFAPPARSPSYAGEGFRPDAFAELAVLEAANFWFRARNKLILWALGSNFPAMQRYMEVGCGTGFVLEAVATAFPQVQLVGTEFFSAGLEIAASRVPRAELLQMDGRRMPYQDEFDVVGAFDVLEHIEEDETVLAQIARALHAGGGLVLTVPQHPWLWSTPDEYACHVRRYKMGELREKVERAGFEVRLETSFVSLLLPAMLASRRGRRTGKQADDAMSELRLPRLLDWALACVMGLERAMIRMGLRLPVGGSLLLVATRRSGWPGPSGQNGMSSSGNGSSLRIGGAEEAPPARSPP